MAASSVSALLAQRQFLETPKRDGETHNWSLAGHIFASHDLGEATTSRHVHGATSFDRTSFEKALPRQGRSYSIPAAAEGDEGKH